MNNNEIWKPIIGYEGLYEVSNLGRVKSLPKGKSNNYSKNNSYTDVYIMKGDISDFGYHRVGLKKDLKAKRFSVHRLVAEAFIENPSNLPEVNHIDGNKLNNIIENLEWTSRRGNARHYSMTDSKKTSKYIGVTKQQKRWVAHIYFNGKDQYIGSYKTEEEANEARIKFETINNISN